LLSVFISGHQGELGTFLNSNIKNPLTVLTNECEIRKADIFLHCLAKHPCHTDEANFDSNIRKSKELCELFFSNRNKEKFFINLSSVSLYDNTLKVIDEDSSTLLLNAYSLSKKVFEDYLKHQMYPHTTLRLPGILEVRSARSLLPRIYELLASNSNVEVTENKHFNHFVSQEYILHKIIQTINIFQSGLPIPLLQNCFEPGEFILSDLVLKMKEVLNSKSNVVINPCSSEGQTIRTKYTATEFNHLSMDDLITDWMKRRACVHRC